MVGQTLTVNHDDCSRIFLLDRILRLIGDSESDLHGRTQACVRDTLRVPEVIEDRDTRRLERFGRPFYGVSIITDSNMVTTHCFRDRRSGRNLSTPEVHHGLLGTAYVGVHVQVIMRGRKLPGRDKLHV